MVIVPYIAPQILWDEWKKKNVCMKHTNTGIWKKREDVKEVFQEVNWSLLNYYANIMCSVFTNLLGVKAPFKLKVGLSKHRNQTAGL